MRANMVYRGCWIQEFQQFEALTFEISIFFTQRKCCCSLHYFWIHMWVFKDFIIQFRVAIPTGITRDISNNYLNDYWFYCFFCRIEIKLQNNNNMKGPIFGYANAMQWVCESKKARESLVWRRNQGILNRNVWKSGSFWFVLELNSAIYRIFIFIVYP